MKKLSLALLVASTLMSGTALANNHTVSIGYAQSDFENLGDIRGVNVQYRYEWDSPFSVMGSFTYLTGDSSEVDDDGASDVLKFKDEVKYYSLLAGPAYRINDYVSVYALGGVSYIKVDEDTTWISSRGPFLNEKKALTQPSSPGALGYSLTQRMIFLSASATKVPQQNITNLTPLMALTSLSATASNILPPS